MKTYLRCRSELKNCSIFRHCARLGRTGTCYSPHILQRTARGSGGTSDVDQRTPAQSHTKSRENVSDHVRDVQRACVLLGHGAYSRRLCVGAKHSNVHRYWYAIYAIVVEN
jgi:hypothetical protein